MRLFLVFILLSSYLHGQNDSCNFFVSGKILDIGTKEPIPYVSIAVKDIDVGTLANGNGEFFIGGLCSPTNVLIISCYGYCDSVCEHHHQHGKVPHIYLKQEVFNLDEIVIKADVTKKDGTKSIAQVSIDQEELATNPTQTLASALSKESGVSLISTGSNVQMPVIHGLYGNRILILNNGFKHGFQNWGHDHAPEIDISSVNKITIIKGAAGVRFGSEALGGVIVVEPNPLYLKEPFYVNTGSGFQTNGNGYNIDFETGKGGDKWSCFANGNFTKIGDRHAPNYSLTNTGKEEKSLGFGARYYSKKWDVKTYYSLLEQNLAVLRASFVSSGSGIINAFNNDQPDDAYILPFSYDINEPNQIIQHHLAKGEVKWRYSDHANLTYRIGKQLNNRKEYDVRRNADRPIINLTLNTLDNQMDWKHPDWFKLDGLIGVQYFYQDNDNNPGTLTTPLIPNYNTSRYSVYAIESKRIGEHEIEGGVRFDYETNNVRGRETNQDLFKDDFSFTNLTSSIGYVKNFKKTNSFRMNIGTAWRTPNMAELYSFGQNGFKNSYGLLRYYFNDNGSLKTNQVKAILESKVKPEKGFKWINELQIEQKNFSHSLTAYSHYIQNFIFEKPYTIIGTFRGPQAVFLFDQVNAVFVGGDYTLKTDFSKWVNGELGVSYLWSRNTTDDEFLINQPPFSMQYELTWKQKKFWKFTASQFRIQPMYQFKQFNAPRTVTPEELIEGVVEITPDSEVFDFKEAPNGYFRLDLSWRFEINQLKGSIAVNNSLNTTYRDYLNEMRYFADSPGRNIIFTLNYTFKHKSKS